MSIGYACLTVGVAHTDQKSCTLKNVSEARLRELISYNLNALDHIIEYNIKNNIKLFRISSDIIPFGSHPMNQICWWEIFASKFQEIGAKIQASGMRVSMHPGQYTVLNSPREEVVERAIAELSYHARVLDSLGVSAKHKIVLHIGGIYQEKKEATNRFINNYGLLDEAIKQRLVIENDDKSYNINDVLEIAKVLTIPVIFDNLHNQINPYDKSVVEYDWICECNQTWGKKDGNQKIHYSSQAVLKKAGSHSNTIPINEFMTFYEGLKRKDIDIMLEVKDKNLSAVKCINCTNEKKRIVALEVEWSKYKYSVLESSPNDYLEIRKLLRDKKAYPAVEFYNFVEDALKTEVTVGNAVNAAQHVWGYFKDCASEKEKASFLRCLEGYQRGEVAVRTVKNRLWKMAEKYQQGYLLDSYYFL